MRHFTRNPVCGTKSHLGPNLSAELGLSFSLHPHSYPQNSREQATRSDTPLGRSVAEFAKAIEQAARHRPGGHRRRLARGQSGVVDEYASPQR
jgi:hypothetical protein